MQCYTPSCCLLSLKPIIASSSLSSTLPYNGKHISPIRTTFSNVNVAK